MRNWHTKSSARIFRSTEVGLAELDEFVPRAWTAILQQEEFRQSALKFGVAPSWLSPVAFRRFIAEELKKWSGVVSAAGIPKQ